MSPVLEAHLRLSNTLPSVVHHAKLPEERDEACPARGMKGRWIPTSPALIREMRQLTRDGFPQRVIAHALEVCPQTVARYCGPIYKRRLKR